MRSLVAPSAELFVHISNFKVIIYQAVVHHILINGVMKQNVIDKNVLLNKSKQQEQNSFNIHNIFHLEADVCQDEQ